MFKLNTNRTFKQPVNLTIVDENGKDQKGSFTANFKILPHSEAIDLPDDIRLLDRVLVSVEGIEVPGEDGQPLTGDELLYALKNDPSASVALANAYQRSIIKKNLPRN
ncbi:hypothetical protein SAMN04487867_12965 [Vreelandella titanicae]|uniref:hypothetical protein n=1 Tax=Vreelandella titanicae TaxID=664683 RepID=UPI00089063ED|nr:hypothetical protein [Halomonas titanicae]SDJ24122.1 hypothetical protein SAMN04487867_12965 [Halomonas titanicae]